MSQKNHYNHNVISLLSFVLIGFMIVLSSAYVYQSSAKHFEHRIAVERHYQHLFTSLQELSLRIKDQEQSWKNMLLRGKESDLYEIYLQQYRHNIDRTNQKLEQLLKATPKRSSSWSLIRQFFSAYEAYNFRYLTALPVYKLAEHDPHITADKYVRKIEDSLFPRIDNINTTLSLEHKEKIEKINAAENSFILNLIAANVAVLILSFIIIKLQQHYNYIEPIEQINTYLKKGTSLSITNSLDRNIIELSKQLEELRKTKASIMETIHKNTAQLISNSMRMKILISESIKLLANSKRNMSKTTAEGDTDSFLDQTLQKLQMLDTRNRENIKIEQESFHSKLFNLHE